MLLLNTWGVHNLFSWLGSMRLEYLVAELRLRLITSLQDTDVPLQALYADRLRLRSVAALSADHHQLLINENAELYARSLSFSHLQHHIATPCFFLRCTECRRGLVMRKMSVRLSVCLSNACIVTKRKKHLSSFLIPYKRSFSLVFWEEEWLVGATTSIWNFGLIDPRWKIADFEIFARSASAVTTSEKKFN